MRSNKRNLRKYAENSDDRQTKRRKSKTMKLIDEVLSKDNLNQAYLQVTRNKGASGIDDMTCEEVKDYLKVHGNELISQVRCHSHKEKVKALNPNFSTIIEFKCYRFIFVDHS